MPTISNDTLDYVVIGLAVVTVICLVFSIVALTANASHKRKFKRYKSIHSTADLDAVYEATMNRVQTLQREFTNLETHVERLQNSLEAKIRTPVIQRYNAFSGVGSDQSFSVALLDGNQNGVVISSIYGREESRMYAKPIRDGQSDYPLTEEEKDVLRFNPSVDSHKVLTRA